MTGKERIIRDREERQRKREEEHNRRKAAYEESIKKSGRTTRLVDRYVQELFYKGSVELKDHYKDGTDAVANMNLVNIFKDRMRREHDYVDVQYDDIKGIYTATINKR